jgi:hypothetical protein
LDCAAASRAVAARAAARVRLRGRCLRAGGAANPKLPQEFPQAKIGAEDGARFGIRFRTLFPSIDLGIERIRHRGEQGRSFALPDRSRHVVEGARQKREPSVRLGRRTRRRKRGGIDHGV